MDQILCIVVGVISLATLILAIAILSRVNALFKELRTPIVKKFSPDLKLHRDTRKPVSQQDLAVRGKSENRENREGREERKPRERTERANRGDRPQGSSRDGSSRDAGRPQRSDRGDRQNRFNKPQGAISNEGSKLLSDSVEGAGLTVDAATASQAAAPAPAAPSEGRRPLTPRSSSAQPAPAPAAAPVTYAAPAAPAPAPAGEGEEAPISFDRSKMNFGRRSQVKKEVIPEEAGEAAA
jgi:hypothetical protein